MVITCPNCHQPVTSTDGICESCWFKIDNIGSSSSSSSPSSSLSAPPKSSQEAPPPLVIGNTKKVCKNQKCTNYNAEYGIDENYCGVCGSTLALEGQHAEKPQDLKRIKGYVRLPDNSLIKITEVPMAIGRIDLSKFVAESDINFISRANATFYKEGEGEEKYFVEDGITPAQEKRSTNGTYLISGGQQKEEITEKGKRELKDGDVINIANVVNLSFTLAGEDDKGIVS